MNLKYAVIIEKGAGGVSAYVPDLPGCVAAAETEDEVRDLIREAIAFHIEGMQRRGAPVPSPTSSCEYVETVTK